MKFANFTNDVTERIREINFKIDDAFPESHPDTSNRAKDYLENLKPVLHSLDRNIGKHANTVFLIAVVFELMMYASVSKVSLFGLEISNLNFIHKLLIVGLAHQFEAFTRLKILRIEVAYVYKRVARKVDKLIVDNELDKYISFYEILISDQPSEYTAEPSLTSNKDSGGFQGLSIKYLSNLILGLLFIFFLIYLHYQYFRFFSVKQFSTWLIFLISSHFFYRAIRNINFDSEYTRILSTRKVETS